MIQLPKNNNMQLYRIRITEEDKIWKRHFTFAEDFICENKEVKFLKFINGSSNETCKIQALIKGKGIVAKSEASFDKVTMPEFMEIQNILFIKEDILNIHDFSGFEGVYFKSIKIYGEFSVGYIALLFNHVIDCIDENKSKRDSFDYLSTLVLDISKVPKDMDGFFLKNWNKYGKYLNIVNEKLKEQLLRIPRAKDFLIFENIQFNNK